MPRHEKGAMPKQSRLPSAARAPAGRWEAVSGVPQNGSTAVLELDGGSLIGEPSYAQEVAVAYLDGRPTLSWLVAPRVEWAAQTGSGSFTEAHSAEAQCRPGGGLSPEVVARELAEALNGHLVLAMHAPLMRRWVSDLFVAGTGSLPAFAVFDLHRRVGILNPLGTEVREASNAANQVVRPRERAATAATRHAVFAEAVATRVQARLRETCQVNPGSGAEV